MHLNQASLTTGLRGARFSPPRAPALLVERAGLTDLVANSVAQLTLICAPAGFGKTTLMQQLRRRFQEGGVATVWLQVERADNDLERFLGSLAGAMQVALGLPSPSQATNRLTSGANLGQGRAADLLEGLSLAETAIALFFDDLELITDEQVWAFLQRVLNDLDMRHRAVFAGRTKPPLALGRIRAHGQLLELGQTELRFTPEETRNYLERQNLGASSIRTLQQHTEGWPAALQLAAAVLNAKHADALRTISGVNSGIAEYLAQEVLDSRPARQRDFLLRSATIGQFCAELCDAALERNDSLAMIRDIVRDNLLLTPIDAEERWYRYHPLFADFLRARLVQEDAREAQQLHRRAAVWTSAHGFANEAIAHALAANDQTLAADLLAVSAMENVRSGRVADTAHAIATLPDAEIYRRPTLLRAAAFAAIFAHRYDAGRRYMDVIARMDDIAGVDDEMVAMRLMLLAWTDSIPDLLRAVELLQATSSRSDRFTAGLAGNARAFCNIALGRYVEAEQDLAQAREACEPINALYVLSYSACFTAAIELSLGQVAAARATLQGAMTRAIAEGQKYGSAGAVIATYLAEVLYEANELDVCQALVEDYMAIVVETGLPDHVIMLHRIAARLHFLNGRRDAGHTVLLQLGEIGARRGLRRLSAAAWLERSHAALHAKDIESARRAFSNGSDATLWESFGPFHPYASEIDDVLIAKLRLQLAAGEHGDALAHIHAEKKAVQSAARRRRALQLSFLEAQALELSGRRREASATFDQVVSQVAELGMVRLLVDDAWATEALAVRSVTRGNPRTVNLLREFKPPRAGTSSLAHRDAARDTVGSRIQLTTREVQILRLVWKGSSNKAIARDLFLTENTIETHLRRIYQKLGTRKRTQAAALAFEAGAI